jgi:hypothetical protein
VSPAATVIGASPAAMMIGLSFNSKANTTTATMHPTQARMSMTTPIQNTRDIIAKMPGNNPIAQFDADLRNVWA